MSAQVLQDIPSVIPLFPLDGTSYTPSQRIQIEIPNSIQSFRPIEAYLSLDVTLPAIAYTGTIVAPDPNPNFVYTSPPLTWSPAGAHGLIRDLSVYTMANGQELDRINFYGVACRGLLPFLHGRDELPLLSQEQGLGMWTHKPRQAVNTTRLNDQLAQPAHPFDLQYFHSVDTVTPRFDKITASAPRTQRYSIPFRFGFMNSADMYLNIGGLRLDMLLDVGSNALDYYNTIIPTTMTLTPATNTLGAGAPLTSFTLTNLAPQLLEYANMFPVGSPLLVTDVTPARSIVTILAYEVSGADIVITTTASAALAVGALTLRYLTPADSTSSAISNITYTISNVALYVRQAPTDAESLREMLGGLQAEMERGGYSFRSLYNYPLQIVANQQSPVLNYNIVPLKYAQGLIFVPENTTDKSSSSVPFPARLCTTLASANATPAANFPNTAPNKYQYQIKLGNDYIPQQMTRFDFITPQILAKEMESFIEVCLEKAMMTNAPYSFDLVTSRANQTKAAINQLYNRPIACVIVPNSMSAMDISTKNIQLLLDSQGAADASAYTVHLFASHFRHLMISGGQMLVDY